MIYLFLFRKYSYIFKDLKIYITYFIGINNSQRYGIVFQDKIYINIYISHNNLSTFF